MFLKKQSNARNSRQTEGVERDGGGRTADQSNFAATSGNLWLTPDSESELLQALTDRHSTGPD